MLVKTDKGCFISDCFATNGYDYNYHHGQIQYLFFDGEQPKGTFYPNWYSIKQYPTLIKKKCDGEVINQRYELKDKSLVSDKMPEVIPYSESENYNADVIDNLYSYEYDRGGSFFEDVPCEIQVICEIENYNFPQKIEYSAIHMSAFENRIYKITNADVHHQIIDKMIFPEVLLPERPCKFTSKQMYDITRQYILEHIDNAVAEITSNYDFCFTVMKRIPLIEPETITYQNVFARTKKERNKIYTKIKKYEKKEIFQMTYSPECYKGYTPIPEMYANNEDELKKKVDAWLSGLMELINKPLCQCPNCNGTGYVDDIKTIGFDYAK